MLNSNWNGKRVCFLGDSITEGVGVKFGERYLDILGNELDIDVHGYGVNGARFRNLMEQAKKMNADFRKNIDAIFLFAGTNDFNGSMPLGNWFNVCEEELILSKNIDNSLSTIQMRKKRSFNMDISTFCGSINSVLSFLKHNYADKQIVLITPLHRSYANFGCDNIQYNELYSNRIGLFIDDYVSMVRQAAYVWSTELIDLYSISGLFPLFDESAHYFANFDTDRLHPGKEGHIRIAKAIKSKMNNIALY